ncbi:MAG: hypothetical protein ACK5TC_00985 [bacterium]
MCLPDIQTQFLNLHRSSKHVRDHTLPRYVVTTKSLRYELVTKVINLALLTPSRALPTKSQLLRPTPLRRIKPYESRCNACRLLLCVNIHVEEIAKLFDLANFIV